MHKERCDIQKRKCPIMERYLLTDERTSYFDETWHGGFDVAIFLLAISTLDGVYTGV